MKVVQPWKHGYGIIPASQMICQQAFTVSGKTANHLANTYALEYNKSLCPYSSLSVRYGHNDLAPFSIICFHTIDKSLSLLYYCISFL